MPVPINAIVTRLLAATLPSRPRADACTTYGKPTVPTALQRQGVFTEAIGRRMEVRGELSDGAEIGLLSAWAEAGELEVLGHAIGGEQKEGFFCSKGPLRPQAEA